MARFSPGTMTAAIFAILVGLGGAFAVRQYLHQPIAAPVKEAVAETPKPVLIPISGMDLASGRMVTMGDVQVMSMTPSELKKSKFAGRAFMGNTQQIIGRTLMAEHKKGEPFLPGDFYPEGMGPGVEEALRPGYRAVTVPIKNIGAVAGFARPGAMVDVYFRSMAHNGNPEMAMTLLERVEILAVGAESFSGRKVTGEEGNVTVSVTPLQAKALKIVEGKGELTLALRRPEDSMIVPVSHGSDAMTLEQLLGLPSARRITKMDIYKGGDKSTVVFDEAALPREERERYGDLISTPIAAEFPANINTTSTFTGSDTTAGGGGGGGGG